jgi:hypothetical protein
MPDPVEDVQTLRDAESVKHALQEAMETSGCLCVHSRCPLHGESTGLLARSWLMLDRLVAELQRLQDENTLMRGLLAKQMPCHYCGAESMAKCPRGFPGCALADDLLIADDVMLTPETTLRLKHRVDTAEARLLAAEHALRAAQELLDELDSWAPFTNPTWVHRPFVTAKLRAALAAAAAPGGGSDG